MLTLHRRFPASPKVKAARSFKGVLANARGRAHAGIPQWTAKWPRIHAKCHRAQRVARTYWSKIASLCTAQLSGMCAVDPMARRRPRATVVDLAALHDSQVTQDALFAQPACVAADTPV